MPIRCTSFVPRLAGSKRQIADLARLARVEMMCQRRLSLLDSLIRLVPKLDVAGSIPVSRSMFSITWEEFIILRFNAITALSSRSPRGARFAGLNLILISFRVPERLPAYTSTSHSCAKEDISLWFNATAVRHRSKGSGDQNILLRNARKTVVVSGAPPRGLASFFTVWRRAAASFGLLRN